MVVSGMRDWNAIWNTEGNPGPDWNEPETYIETLQLLVNRGERWIDCVLQLADRDIAVAELAGERLIINARPTNDEHCWEYHIIGDHSGREWGRVTLDTRVGIDDLVTGVLLRIAFNGRHNSSEEDFVILRNLLNDQRVFSDEEAA
jgi:hypothetical protein